MKELLIFTMNCSRIDKSLLDSLAMDLESWTGGKQDLPQPMYWCKLLFVIITVLLYWYLRMRYKRLSLSPVKW